jgi:hypothetical protein
MHKTNVAHFLLHTYESIMTETVKPLILNALGCGCCMLLLGAISVEDGYAHNKNSGHVLQVAKAESVTALQCALHTPFHTATPQCCDFCGLLWKQAYTWSTYISDTEG